MEENDHHLSSESSYFCASRSWDNTKKKSKKHLWVFPKKKNGTPKSSILIGFSIINHPFWGTPIFGNTHMNSISGETEEGMAWLVWYFHLLDRLFWILCYVVVQSASLPTTPKKPTSGLDIRLLLPFTKRAGSKGEGFPACFGHAKK